MMPFLTGIATCNLGKWRQSMIKPGKNIKTQRIGMEIE